MADTTGTENSAPIDTEAVTAAPDAASEIVDTTVDPIEDFVNSAYETVEKWEAQGPDYQEFVNHPSVPAERVIAMDAVIADIRAHLHAMEEPVKVTGLPSYGPAQMLTDLRHLRELNKTEHRAGGTGLYRRISAPRAKIRWGVVYTDHAPVTGAAHRYANEIDRFAYRLALAVKAHAAQA